MVTWPSASSTTLPSLRTHKTVVPCIAPLLCALFWLIGIPPLYAAPGKAQKPRTLVLLYLLIRISSEVFMPRRSASLRLIVCFFLFAISTFAYSAAPTADSWNRLSDDFVDQYLAFSPTASTQVGIHIHDAKLDDYSPASIAKQIAWLQQFEKRVLAFDAKMLSATDAADREILLNNIRANLLELQVIRTFAKNPDTYSSGAASSVYVIMSRKFAPADERLRSVIAREKQFPRFFADARSNLKDVPRIYTEIALEQLPGTIGFFEKDVPSAFADAVDPRVKSDFAESNAAAIKVLREYETWLKSDLLQRSNGDFRIGGETFSQKLLYDDMVTAPLDRLLEIGMADLRNNQSEFQRVAKEVDPSKSAAEVLARLQSMHPAPTEVMQSFRNTFDGLIAFINSHHIISLPGKSKPTLQETPPFQRATT